MAHGPYIEVDELRAAVARLLTAVEARFGSRIDLAADHYWSLDPPDAFQLDAGQPPELVVGQLSDDVQEV